MAFFKLRSLWRKEAQAPAIKVTQDPYFNKIEIGGRAIYVFGPFGQRNSCDPANIHIETFKDPHVLVTGKGEENGSGAPEDRAFQLNAERRGRCRLDNQPVMAISFADFTKDQVQTYIEAAADILLKRDLPVPAGTRPLVAPRPV